MLSGLEVSWVWQGYYRRFVMDFSSVAALLTKLTRNGVTFEWNEDCERSFQELKHCLTHDLVLALPDNSGEYEVYTNASHQGLGYVLMQHGNR